MRRTKSAEIDLIFNPEIKQIAKALRAKSKRRKAELRIQRK